MFRSEHRPNLSVKCTALFNSISETFDDIYHLMLYSQLMIYSQFNDTEKIIFLMKHTQRQFSKFSLEAYCLRRNLLYNKII